MQSKVIPSTVLGALADKDDDAIGIELARLGRRVGLVAVAFVAGAIFLFVALAQA